MVGELVTKSDLVCNWSVFGYFAKKASDCNGRRLSYWLESPVSSSATWNLAWNFGR